MRVWVVLFLVLAVGLAMTEKEIREEVDSNIEEISSFLLELIEKYDQSGKGAISIQQYPAFLAEVLVTGHTATTPHSKLDSDIENLLLNATTAFAQKYNTTEVGVQDFYFDLIKEFTSFLLEHESQYSPIIDTFFGDTPFDDQPNPGYGDVPSAPGQQGSAEAQEL